MRWAWEKRELDKRDAWGVIILIVIALALWAFGCHEFKVEN